jgi:SAM-dependent methyltransferase
LPAIPHRCGIVIYRHLLPAMPIGEDQECKRYWTGPLEPAMTDRFTPEQIEQINKLQKKYFNDKVDLFEAPLPEGVPERLKTTVKASGLRSGERVLDVGTGTGILITFILKYVPAEIHACDLSENMLQRVKEKFPQVIVHRCDIRDLPLSDDSLDVVFINACFSNIIDKSKSLDNIYRLLRQQGRLVISHPLGRNFIVELKKHTPFHLDMLPDQKGAKGLLERHGFEVIRFRDEPAFYLVVAKTTKPDEPSVANHEGPT